MRKRYHKKVILLIALILSGVGIFVFQGIEERQEEVLELGQVYVRGKYSEGNCYVKGSEHGNIKYLLEYDSLQDCLDSYK